MELTLKIPENLNEITLGQYQKYLKMEKENEEQKEVFFYKKEKVFKKYACSCATPQLKAR